MCQPMAEGLSRQQETTNPWVAKVECDKYCKPETVHTPKGKLKFLDIPRLIDTQTLCLGTDSSIIFYFAACLGRVLLPGGGGHYCFPILKTTSHCLGVNPQHWCSWSSSVISSEVTEPQKTQPCAECSTRQTNAQSIDLWRTNMSPCSSASIFGDQTWMWPFIP